MRKAALTCRSYYSLLRGAASVEALTQKAKEYGYDCIALADVNGIYGVVDFVKAAEKVGIRPIIGVEILTDSQRATLLAENELGYKNLCRIITSLNLEERFDLAEQLEANNEGVICISGQRDLLKQLKGILSEDSLFVGLWKGSGADRIKGSGVKPVAVGNFNVIDYDDIIRARLLSRIRQLSVAGGGPEDCVGYNRLIPAESFENRFVETSEAIANNQIISQRCNFELLDGDYHLPEAVRIQSGGADKELARLSHIGLAKKYGTVSKGIVKRLEYELSVIRKNRFSGYFLAVKEIVDFAKSKKIPVDVRGSAAGSLVSYVLGFTRVCPIENKLYFERFMNPGRRDCPDIDVDLCWRRRDEVIRFCYENWGYENVAMISTLNRYRFRSAIRDVARAVALEPCRVEGLIAAGRYKPDSPLYKLAQRIVKVPRHVGVHCGGIVITPEPVENIAPLQWTNKGVIVTQYDKDAAEAVGLVKIDLLGNRSLSTVDEAVNIISRDGRELDIDAVESCDEKTAHMLSKGESLGVFQCESPGMRQLLSALAIRNKNDVAIALSLIRPGPAAGGMKAEFIERRVRKKAFTYIHPRLNEVLGETYGVMLYQEDVMKIAVEVAGYGVAEADRFRSEVSKKVSAGKLQEQYEEFVYSRADKAGIDRQSAEAIWDEILRFAAYSYCKAHATVYANIAWQTAYLKAHFPQEFYCSLFNNHHGMYPLRVYVWDAIRHGIRILSPHVNKSQIEWSIEGRAIRAGLNITKGLSHSAMREIVAERNIMPFGDLNDLRTRVKICRPQLRDLIHTGACDGLANSRPAMLLQLHYKPVRPGQLTLFEVPPNPSRKQLPDYDRVAKLKAEIDVTGIPFSLHPELLIHQRHRLARNLPDLINREVTVAGYLATARQARTSDGRVMGFATLEDSSGLAEISFFPDRMELYRKICSMPGAVWITGKVTEHLSSITIEGHNCGTAA